MVIWFTGISGSGKSTLGKYFYKKFKTNYPNTIYLDGDQFRKLFKNDLNYTLRDRDKNAQRITSFVKYLSKQKMNMVVAANLTSQKYRNWCKKNINNYFEIYISAKMKVLKKRDYKKIYKKAFEGKITNVVGVDIRFKKPKSSDLILTNNKSKKILFSKYQLILRKIKEKYDFF